MVPVCDVVSGRELRHTGGQLQVVNRRTASQSVGWCSSSQRWNLKNVKKRENSTVKTNTWTLQRCLNVSDCFQISSKISNQILANLVVLLYLGSLFTWEKVIKVHRPLPNHIKEQRLVVHILCYISLSYLDEMLNTMFECEKLCDNSEK